MGSVGSVGSALLLAQVRDVYGNPNDGGRQHAMSGHELGLLPPKDLRLQMGKCLEGMRKGHFSLVLGAWCCDCLCVVVFLCTLFLCTCGVLCSIG